MCVKERVALVRRRRHWEALYPRTPPDGARDSSPAFSTDSRHNGGVTRLHLPAAELTWRFSRSSGPGGQHVNTSDTRVQLSFDLAGSAAFPDSVKERLLSRLGEVVVVVASEHRSQLRNRRAAEDRLVDVLEEALKPPPPTRVPTKPSKASQQRRLQQKKRRGATKQLRGRPED
jgi:ribosome-associated protein